MAIFISKFEEDRLILRYHELCPFSKWFCPRVSLFASLNHLYHCTCCFPTRFMSSFSHLNRFLHCLRATLPDKDSLVFVYAVVWAEMKKTASYRVDASFRSDGVVEACQCECGAGEGPTAHCKHVGAVLYGLSCFYQSGDILTELTCTQVDSCLI